MNDKLNILGNIFLKEKVTGNFFMSDSLCRNTSIQYKAIWFVDNNSILKYRYEVVDDICACAGNEH